MNNYGDGISQQIDSGTLGRHRPRLWATCPTDAASSRIRYSRAEDQEKEDQKEQQVNAALQDARFAAGKCDDADG
jgi:hypothetical protein